MYLEFAWVYWRRQRVKLRSGGVLDHEDWVTGGLLLRWVFGSHEGESASKGTTGGSWRDWARDRLGASRGRPRGRGGVSVSADEDGVGGMLARGPRGGRYNDEEAGYVNAETGRGSSRAGVRQDSTGEEGRVLVGDSDDEDDNTTVWQHGGVNDDEEGIVLAGSDDDGDDDESRMTANEIRDRRGN